MTRSRSFLPEICALSFAALLLEVSYTRVVSFKFWYFYAYLVLGLAMLGIGSGAIGVTLARAWPRRALEPLFAAICLVASIAVSAGYLVVARVPFDTQQLWSGFAEPAKLALVCLSVFAGFFAIGTGLALLLARRPAPIHRLYFADLVGAGLGASAVVPLLATIGPPASVMLAAAVIAATGLAATRGGQARSLRYPLAAVLALLAVPIVAPQLIPDPVTDSMGKTMHPGARLEFSRWSPVFRIDVSKLSSADDRRVLMHDGLWGSVIVRFDGDLGKFTEFDSNPRALPFATLGEPPPAEVALIGSAGGHEILASLYFDAQHVTAVELNPVTVSLLTDHFADYTGHLDQHPRVDLVNAEGRSFLARSQDRRFDLVYFMAPDSYSAQNAASAGAYVLSESYLYTVEAIEQSLERLSERGIICAQFGEWAYDQRPVRSARYLTTAREALRRRGVRDFDAHVLVATTPAILQLTTVLIKATPFTQGEIQRFVAKAKQIPDTIVRHPGRALEPGPVNQVIELGDVPLKRFLAELPYDIDAVTDDAPYFWHFARFRNVIRGFAQPFYASDMEDTVGERLLITLLGIALVFSALFLLLPFARVGGTWRLLPHKGRAALYFGALGFGFLAFEIPLMQKLTLLLGYPTHSLTVTLASLLVASGLGSLASSGTASGARTLARLLAAIALLTLFYAVGLDFVVDACLPAPFALRVLIALVVVAPLGFVLGWFLPVGLAAFSATTTHPSEAVAWAWAVNGFGSVVGSILVTILSMTFGFAAVLWIALATYALAVAALRGFAAPAAS